jgi:hypothetical protein
LKGLRQLYRFCPKETLDDHARVAGLLSVSDDETSHAASVAASNVEDTTTGDDILSAADEINDIHLRGILKAFLKTAKLYKRKVKEEDLKTSVQNLADICLTCENFNRSSVYCLVALQGTYKLYDTYVKYVSNPVLFRNQDRLNQINFSKYKTRDKFLSKFVITAKL